MYYHPRFKGFIQRNLADHPTISTSIIDPLHSDPEPPYLSCINNFDGWFGIPFKYVNCFTHVRSTHPYEILTLHGLSALVPLYPCTIFALQIRTLVLHTFSFRVSNYIANNFFSNIIPPTIPPPHHIQSISNCFILQPLTAKHTWQTAYQEDSDTKIFYDHFTLNAPLNQSTILNLPEAYRTALSCNQLGLLEGRLVYYEQLSFANKHIYRIVVPLLLRHKIFNIIHATLFAGLMGEYKTLYRIRLRFLWPRMRADIKEWIQQCPQYALTYCWRRRGQELMFFWHVSSPFAILHIDL